MSVFLIVLIFLVLAIDFLAMHKHDKRTVFVYLGIVFTIVVVLVVDKYDLFEMSPLEYLIEGVDPVVNWVSQKLNPQ